MEANARFVSSAYILFAWSCGNGTQKIMRSGLCYTISNVAIKEFNGANYLTLAKHSTVNEAKELNIDLQDDIPDKTQELKGQSPPDGINYVTSYFKLQQVSLESHA